MSNRTDGFECRWRPSVWLLRGYLLVAGLALVALFLLELAAVVRLMAVLALLGYLAWSLPRQVLLSHPACAKGLRYQAGGWSVFSPALGWHPVRLRRDCVVLPALVIVRYRAPGQWRTRSVCIPCDSLGEQTHRQLRVRLRFGRGRFAPLSRAPARPASHQTR